ncbi:hypothetical protein COV17_00050 [Candidatus Woesearchaeota archaeon CG10_big_fil_rev_8_21_14_0_10_36_11]|nr:MAG: hypothetical protein COV17_00050 [Candidatus Woesearchaeota archaeon CG10_big_fil_rev_8_21_14_0_10_36_11]
MRYFYSKNIDKRVDLVVSFLDTYWKEFVSLNKDSERIIFPTRNHIMKASPFSRRNAYKHIHKLLFYHIFTEERNTLIPTSFTFKINGTTFNTSSYVFEEILPLNLKKEQLYLITPKIKTTILIALLERVMVDGCSLREYCNISIGAPENYSYTQKYHYSELPRTSRMIEVWNQTDKAIAKQEQKLLEVMSPIKDPLSHNTALFLIPNSSSPFIQIDKINREYVLAAWCSHIIGDELKGGPDDETKTNSYIEFYDENKNTINSANFVFGNQGLNLMTDLLVVSSRIEPSGELLGWYDFKNNIPAGKRVHNHILISFIRLMMPENTTYFKIFTHDKSYFAFISLFPYSKFPKAFIELRRRQPSRFVQHTTPIFYYEKCPEIRTPKEYIEMNKKLLEASFVVGSEKNELLKSAILHLNAFFVSLREDIKRAMKSVNFSVEFLHIVNSSLDAKLLLSLAIRNKSTTLKSSITKEIIKDYHLTQELISFLREHTIFVDHILFFLITNFRQYRDVKFYLKRDLELANLRKIVQENKEIVNKSNNSDLKIEVYKWLLTFERTLIENKLMQGEKIHLCEIQETFQNLATTYKLLADHVKQFSWLPSKENIFRNKYWLYKSLSLFYTFSEISFKAKVFTRITSDPCINELSVSLQEFEKKLF